jgi:alpha-tubulin suppressor-like RCC1 family protein
MPPVLTRHWRNQGPRNAVDSSDLQDLLRVLTGPLTTAPSTTQTIELPQHESATHLTATATSFALLTASGTIYTWSTDTRPSPLGRLPVPEPGAHPIDALGGIPVKKLAAAGWLAAAVSRDNELYIWGGSGPGGTRKISDLKRSEGELVALAKVGAVREEEDGVSVVDVAVGDRHVVALGENGSVFAVGEGTNGQLGTGRVDFAEEWVECTFEGHDKPGKAVGVYCGPRNTFVLVSQRLDGGK